MIFTMAELRHFGMDVPDDYTRHDWSYSVQVRFCWQCGTQETMWDDIEYPYDPCPAVDLRDDEAEESVDITKVQAWFDAVDEKEAKEDG